MHGNQRQTDLAYIAGVMDADGCFMITKHKRKWKGKYINPSYLPCVKISQAEPETIEFIANELGYGTYKLDRARKRFYENGKQFGSKPMYDWFIRDKKVLVPFLEGIIPYLKIKAERAEHLKEYCLNIHQTNFCRGGIPQSELDYREDMYIKMREFNGNKVAATTESSGPERVSDSLAS